MARQCSKFLDQSKKSPRRDSVSFNIGDAYLVFFKIVTKTARAGALAARYMQILTSKRAIGKVDFGIRAVHPCAAEPTASQNDAPITFPSRRIVILTTDRQANGRRTLPFPLPEKFIQLRGRDPADRLRDDCAFDV